MDVSKLTLDIFSALEQKWLMKWGDANPWSPEETKRSSKKKTFILSIDGGCGMKGLVAGEALIHLEETIRSLTSDPAACIADHFDLIAGTGVGGILAAMISASDGSGRPLFSARGAVDFLRSRRRHLFRRAGSGLLRRSRRWKYSGGSFEGVLREALRSRDGGRQLTLRDTCRPLLVPCYDVNSSGAFVFSRADAVESPSFDFELWRVCRATSATPGLLRPFEVASVDGRTACTAVDGGIVMNNPSAVAVTHVLHNKREFPSVAGVEDLVVLSLGHVPPSPAAVMEIMLDGISEAVDQILCNAFRWNPTDYIRIQDNGWRAEAGVKEEEETVEGLRRAGERLLKERGVESLPFGGKRLLTATNGERIDGLVQRLVVARGGPVTDLNRSPATPCKTKESPPASLAKCH